MAIPASGQIAFAGTIGVELGRSSTATISMSESVVYGLAGTSAGAQVSFSTFYGKANTYTFNQTISSDTTNYNLKSAAIAAGWNGTTKLAATVTINSGVFVYSNSTGSYAFDTGSTFPSGSTLALVNNGTIIGKGGDGGNGGGGTAYTGNETYPAAQSVGGNGGAAGPAFIAQYAINVTNNGAINGGGGGGGGGGCASG
jgi:hypothetical protein